MENVQNITPISAAKGVSITQVLGRVNAPGCTLVDTVKPKANNTRWVIDVEGESGKDVVIELLTFEGGNRRVKPDFIRPTLVPLSASFYKAQPYCIINEAEGTLTLCSSVTSEPCKYRVTIDTMHSASR